MSFFVTGTDTGVGKTRFTTLLLAAFRQSGRSCAGLKPICCGDRQDAEKLFAASSEGATLNEINPVWLRAPAAPLTAAQIESRMVDVSLVLQTFNELKGRFDSLIVEGIGGWLVPIRRDYFVSDLAAEMQLPVIVVAQNRLGCLNHTILTVRSIAERGLVCAGIVLNAFPASHDLAALTNRSVLEDCLDVPILTEINAETEKLDAGFLPTLGVAGRG